jgi:hypothetical protein
MMRITVLLQRQHCDDETRDGAMGGTDWIACAQVCKLV